MAPASKARRLERAATLASAAAIAAMAISISATQICIGLSIALFFFSMVYSGREGAQKTGLHLPPPLREGALLACGLILSLLYHCVRDPGPWLRQFLAGANSELSDLPLFLFGFLVFRLTRHEDQRRILEGALLVCGCVLIVSGVASVFSEFRLERLLTGVPPVASAANRPQHPLEWPIHARLFRPTGLMNTRLTYAGMLVLLLPGWIAPQETSARLRYLKWSLAIAGIVLLLANGSRSAQVGFVLSLPALALLLMHKHTRLRWAFPGVAAVVLLGAALLLFAYPTAPARAFELLVGRHTDYSRLIIWSTAGDLTAANPLFGVGPGNYEAASLSWRSDFLIEHPELWYYFENAPRGHAHNDLLHLAAVGGLPGALLFLALCFQVARGALNGATRARSLFIGCLALLGAGFAQCYYQDDEVVSLFWVVAALATGAQTDTRRSSHFDPHFESPGAEVRPTDSPAPPAY